MIVNVFIKNKTVLNWFNQVNTDLKGFYDFNIHSTIFSFSNELSLKGNQSVSLIDLDFENYFHYTNEITKSNPGSRFIGIGIEKSCNNIIDKINNNILGYVSVYDEQFILAKAIDCVQHNNIYLKQENINELISLLKKDKKSNSIKEEIQNINIQGTTKNVETLSLSEKEARVCKLLTEGYSYKEIASIIGFTTYSVNQKTKSIYKKLGVRSRSELSYKLLN